MTAKIKYYLASIALFFLSSKIVFAQLGGQTGSGLSGQTGSGGCQAGTICNPIPNVTSLNDLLKDILQGVIKIGIPIITLALIYSGFLFVTAQGNSEKLKSAKKALLYTVIGAAVLLGSWAIAQLIHSTVSSL